MIYVSEDQLAQVEYLIDQSMQGNHVLFDPTTVRKVFLEKHFGEDISDEEAYEVEHHIERIILEPTLSKKRAYLEKLESETHDLVVRTYFNIVENNIYENIGVIH